MHLLDITRRDAHRRLVRRAWGFARSLEGRSLFLNGTLGTNASGAQCVNVPNSWWDTWGVPAVPGDAVDWIGFSDSLRSWHGGPGEAMRAGDVAVFFPSAPVSAAGHVDLVLNGAVDPYVGLDQNWPEGEVVRYLRHERSMVAGVIRMRRV